MFKNFWNASFKSSNRRTCRSSRLQFLRRWPRLKLEQLEVRTLLATVEFDTVVDRSWHYQSVFNDFTAGIHSSGTADASEHPESSGGSILLAGGVGAWASDFFFHGELQGSAGVDFHGFTDVGAPPEDIHQRSGSASANFSETANLTIVPEPDSDEKQGDLVAVFIYSNLTQTDGGTAAASAAVGSSTYQAPVGENFGYRLVAAIGDSITLKVSGSAQGSAANGTRDYSREGAAKISADASTIDLRALPTAIVEGNDGLGVNYSFDTYDIGSIDPNLSVGMSFVWAKQVNPYSPDFVRIGTAKEFSVKAGDGLDSDTGWQGGRVLLSDLGARPTDATHLLFIVDAPNAYQETDEDDNVFALPILPDLSVQEDGALTWRDVLEGGGVDLAYDINIADLPERATVSFFWEYVDDTKEDGVVRVPAASGTTVTGQGDNYHLIIRGASFSPPPNFHANLVVELDPEHTIEEQSEGNNESSISGLFAANVKSQVEVGGASSFTFDDAAKNEPYTVSFIVSNLSPVPIPGFTLNWKEERVEGTAPQIPSAPGVVREDISVPPIRFGSHETISRTLKHNWEWIASKNPITDDLVSALKKSGLGASKELAKNLGANIKAAGVFNTVLGKTIELFTIALDTEPRNTFNYFVKPQENIVLTGAFSTNVNVGVPVFRQVAFGSYLLLKAKAGSDIGKGLAQIAFALSFGGEIAPALLVESANTFTVAAAELLVAAAAYEKAKDPPDSDYKVLVEPATVTVPITNPPLGGIAREAIKTQLTILSLQTAELSARNKADGAELAGDLEWQSKQLIAAGEFAKQAVSLQTKAISLDSLLSSARGAQSGANVGDALNYLRTNGLPTQATSILVQAGWTSAQIQTFADAVMQTTAVPSNNADDELATARLNAALESFAAFDQQAQGITLRVSNLGQPTVPITSSQKNELTARQMEIEALLAKGLSSNNLATLIHKYISDVSELLNATNNVDGLKPNLDYGYSALVRMEELDARPAALHSFVESKRAGGDITDLAASSLNSIATYMEQALGQTHYAVYAAKVSALTGAIGRMRGTGISVQVADCLSDYAAYLHDLNGKWDFPWHNDTPLFPASATGLDVNADGYVVADDVLMVINFINANPGNTDVPLDSPVGGPQGLFLDVFPDNHIVAGDVLTIINWINAHPSGVGVQSFAAEGEAATNGDVDAGLVASGVADHVALTPPAPSSADFDAVLALLAADAATVQRRRRI